MQYIQLNRPYFRKNNLSDSQIVITQDEVILILTYIIIHSKVPDLCSQIELITAFASTYMQESEDGCQISSTYLNLIAC
jgi:hypothetical protein